MIGHVRRRGRSWAFVTDVAPQPCQRCQECAKRRFVDRAGPVERCGCGGPLGPVHPERRQRWQSGYRTRKAAEEALRVYLRGLDTGGDPFPEQITLTAYLDRWLDHHGARVRPRTLARYRQLLDGYVRSTIGTLQLTALRPAHVQACFDAAREAGRKPATIVQLRACLGAALNQAVAWGLIPANPVRAVKRPRIERPELKVPDAAQILVLIDAAKVDDEWAIPVLLSATTGARRGEILGLRWADFDPDRARLRITRSLQRIDGESRFTEPKTPRARREVAVPGFVVDALRAHRTAQARRRLACGEDWTDLDLIVERGDGQPVDPGTYGHAFVRIARKAGLAGVRLHDLRHAYATALLEGGVHPGVASAVLGHASPAFTMSAYQHVMDHQADRAAAALETVLDAAR